MLVLSGRRRRSAAVAAAAVCAFLPPAGPAVADVPTPLDDAGYVAVATDLQHWLDERWDPRLERYDVGPGEPTTTEINADLLAVHAVAAERGLGGPPRPHPRAPAGLRPLPRPPILA